MGLDMYLYKRNYVQNWDFKKPEERYSITVKKGGKTVEGIKPERISYIIESVGQWRKANAIHKWFVTNVQEGNDDCEEYYVSEEKIKELLDVCNKIVEASKLVKGIVNNGYTFENGKKTPIVATGKIIKDPAVAKKLLPTEAGFFFGGTDYDEYYLSDIKNTIDILTQCLKEKDGDFYYDSSW